MSKYQSWLLFIAYLIFLRFIYIVPKTNSKIEVASWLGPQFWVPEIIFFVMGFFGIRTGWRYIERRWDGTRVSGFVDEGPVSGTAGVKGGVALGVAYATFILLAGLLNVILWKFITVDGPSIGTMLLCDVIMFVLMIPMYFLFLYLLNRDRPVSWIICGVWALFLLYVVRI